MSRVRPGIFKGMLCVFLSKLLYVGDYRASSSSVKTQEISVYFPAGLFMYGD